MPPPKGAGTRKPTSRRGKAAATDDSESQPTASQTSSATAALSTASNVTQNNQSDNDSPAHSPNSSPATVPTETPAPTPIRASAASSSMVAPPSSRGRGGLLGQRGRSAAVSKFKPKAVRRDGAERERLVREENAREAQRLKEEQAEVDRLNRGLPRSRGGRGRGARGQYSNLSRPPPKASTASGLFSQLPEASITPGASSGWSGGLGSGHSATSSRVKNEGGAGSGHGGRGGGFRKEGGGGGGGGGEKRTADHDMDDPDYGDEDDESQRVNIDLLSREDNGAEREFIENIRTGGRGKGKEIEVDTSGMMPVRLRRVKPKEKTTIINLEADTKIDDPELVIDEERSSRENASDNTVRIKSEPGLVDDEATSIPGLPPSPESKRKSRQRARRSSAMELDEDGTENGIPELKRKSRQRASSPSAMELDDDTTEKSTSSKKKGAKVLLHTEEDIAEHERRVKELEFLTHTLGRQPILSKNGNGGPIMVANEETGEMEPEKKNFALDGNLFLFQLPPVLPQLYNPTKSSKPGSKDAKGKGKAFEDVVGIAASPDKTGKKAKAMKAKPKVAAQEEEVEVIELEDEAPPELIEEDGRMGTMIVRASGKVELSWGGTSMLANKGMDSHFLSTAVIVDSRERPGHQSRDGEPEGIATGMGMIYGKFILVPDVEKMN